MLAGAEHFADRRREIIHAGAWNNDRVPSAMRFFGDTKEFSAIVFAKLNVKTLSFDLKLLCFDNAVHFRKRDGV